MVKTLSLLSCTFVFSSLLATDLKNIEKVTIHSGVSDIKVLPLPANQVLSFKEVYKRPCAESHKIHFKVEQKDKELIFTAENSDGVKKVHPDLEVFVPSSLILDINVGSADVKVKSDLKELIVKSGDGDVDLYGAVNKLDVYSGNGDIEIHSNAAQKEGKFNLTTGNGDIEVKLLKGVKVQRDIKTGNGDIEEKILPEDPKAPVLDLVIKSGNGDVKLKQVEKE